MGGGVEKRGGGGSEDGRRGWEEGGKREGRRVERRMISFEMFMRSFLLVGIF
jgi:hypothetical protein